MPAPPFNDTEDGVLRFYPEENGSNEVCCFSARGLNAGEMGTRQEGVGARILETSATGLTGDVGRTKYEF